MNSLKVQKNKLKQKLKEMFLSQPENRGFVTTFPREPIKIKDDPLNRCFNFIDKNRKQFLSLTVPEIKLLPKYISKYFTINSLNRHETVNKDLRKLVSKEMRDRPEFKDFPKDTEGGFVTDNLRFWAFKKN